MDLIRTKKDNTQLHLLLKDHIPNFAMKNEFQTTTFKLRVFSLEIYEHIFEGYVIEEGGMFLCVNCGIKNLTNEILSFYSSELTVSYDHQGPFVAEEFFEVTNQFEDEIALRPNEEVKGKFVFMVAKDAKKIVLRYLEQVDDERVKEYRLRYQLSM